MAQAPIQSPINGQAESSTAASIPRNDDPLTLALREEAAINIDDIARLNRAVSPAYDALSSMGSSSTAVFTPREESTVTKPTSTGTSHPVNNVKSSGKGKERAPYASSLSVAYGSGSEAEAQQDAFQREALFAVGDWVSKDIVPAVPLKGGARAKRRYRHEPQPKHKKPIVEIIHYNQAPNIPINEDVQAVVTTLTGPDRPAQKYLRKRTTQHEDDPFRLAEEGWSRQATTSSRSRKGLSSTRVYILVGIIIMMVATVAVSLLGAHHTGKNRAACTKGIVFGSTVLLAGLTGTAMIVGRRGVQEALLASLLVIVIGFTLLRELDDFM